MSLLSSLSQFALEVIRGTELRRGTTSPIDQIAPLHAGAHGSSSADIQPSPFKVNLHFPHEPLSGQHIDGLFVALTEILRLYRAFIAHGKDL